MKKAVGLALILVMTLFVFAGCDNAKTSVEDNNDTNVTDTDNVLEDSDIIPEEHTDETVEKDTERESEAESVLSTEESDEIDTTSSETNAPQEAETETEDSIEDAECDHFVFELSEDGTYYILTSYKNCECTDLVIPEVYNGLPVATIANEAFYRGSCDSLFIPASIKYIEHAGISTYFSVEKIVISDIAYWCAIDFESARSNPLSDSTYLYLNDELVTELVIPDSVTEIKDYAFYELGSITSVKLGNGVVSIGKNVFVGCEKLENVEFNNGITTIGGYAFQKCISLKQVELPDSVTSVGCNAFEYCSELQSAKLSSSMTVIEENLFSECTSLEIVEIPYGIVEIKLGAFEETAIKTFDMPDSVETVGTAAFQFCESLESIKLSSKLQIIPDGMLWGCSALKTIDIPSSVYAIREYAFASCKLLEEVVLMDTIKTVEKNAFDSCDSLKFNIHNELKYLGNEENPYYALISLPNQDSTEYILHPNTVIIAIDAFMNCKQLETLVIPKSVRYLHGGLFSDCENIKNITLPFVGGSRDPEEEYSSLSYLFGGEVPYGIQTITITDCEHIPAAAFSGIEFERIVFPDGLKTIGDGAFRSCHISSGEIVIPDTVTSIGAGAFCEISFLTTVKLPANLESIGANAFSKTRINNIELPDNIKAIDNGAFAYCERLEKITIPSSVKTIGETAFYGCKMLEYVELSEGLEYIGDRAFEGTALWGLSLPSTIKHVGKDILYTWVSMASSKDGVLYRNGGSNLTMFLVGVHDRNKNQTTYTISPDTKVIYYNAFRDCNNLEEIVIPYGVTTICDNAFGFSLKKITVPVTVTSIGDGAFKLYPETEFVYEGTVAQWNAIEKNNPISRFYEDTVIVKCSDGNIVFSPETDAE